MEVTDSEPHEAAASSATPLVPISMSDLAQIVRHFSRFTIVDGEYGVQE